MEKDLKTTVAGGRRSENETKLRTILNNLNRDAKTFTMNTGFSDAEVSRTRLTGDGMIVGVIVGIMIVVIVFRKP
ncbi:hypothetical protein TSUD_135610 [Trifolium subterraneum]|uniref:Uncharacterized protein n=1 Tax=Trifolium subterraneum TaxID=3900 RepID=A0A2Z6NWA8_TRISU|nr:hypothetical protein TSUD_135610 [Trifolium subterraneum]